MGQELVLPDWAKGGAAPAFAVLNPSDDSLSEGIGQSYPVIGYKGKVWSFRYRGERRTFIRPDDGTPAAYLDVIILGQAKQKSKSFYKAFDPNQSDGDRPICSSIDGVIPDPDVQQKQCDTCALCPRNAWKQQSNGKKGRECTDYKRLAVLVLPTQTKLIFPPDGVLEPAFLRVPPASLNSLAIMGDTMAAQGFHYSSYITRITFDPQEAHPKMVFKPLQGLSNAEAPVILQLRQDMNVDRIINGGFAEAMRQIPPQEGTTLLPPASTATGLVQETAPVQQVQPQGQVLNLQVNPAPSTVAAPTPNPGQTQPQGTVSTGLGSVQPATVAPAPATASGLAQGSATLGAIGSGGATPAQTQPASPPTSDIGAAEASDDDLDKKIAGMLGKGAK